MLIFVAALKTQKNDEETEPLRIRERESRYINDKIIWNRAIKLGIWEIQGIYLQFQEIIDRGVLFGYRKFIYNFEILQLP